MGVSLRPRRRPVAAAHSSLHAISGAGEGNRTLVVSLEGFCSTIELHPQFRYQMTGIRDHGAASARRFLMPDLSVSMVEGEGFEPSKAEPADLQSAPFDRSGTPPTKREIVAAGRRSVKPDGVPAQHFRGPGSAGKARAYNQLAGERGAPRRHRGRAERGFRDRPLRARVAGWRRYSHGKCGRTSRRAAVEKPAPHSLDYPASVRPPGVGLDLRVAARVRGPRATQAGCTTPMRGSDDPAASAEEVVEGMVIASDGMREHACDPGADAPRSPRC